MNLIAKSAHIVLSTFPKKPQQLIRDLLPLSIKRYIGEKLMQASVKKMDLIEVDDGRRFRVIEDRLFLRVIYEKNYEPTLSAIATRLIEKGDNVVDVGANFGWYSTLFCKQVISGTVTSYEPAPHSYRILDENIKLNEMNSIINIRKVGVGAEKGSFLMEPGTSSESGLAHVVVQKSDTTIETPVVKLDTDLKTIVGEISYIKFDIEGYEYSALIGAKSLLQVQNQPIIQIELNDEALNRGGASRNEVITFLEECGYSFYEAAPEFLGKLRETNAYKCSDTFCFGKGIYANRLNDILIS